MRAVLCSGYDDGVAGLRNCLPINEPTPRSCTVVTLANDDFLRSTTTIALCASQTTTEEAEERQKRGSGTGGAVLGLLRRDAQRSHIILPCFLRRKPHPHLQASMALQYRTTCGAEHGKPSPALSNRASLPMPERVRRGATVL